MKRALKSAALAALAASVLAACSTYVTPRYSISADTNVALKSLGLSGVGVGAFSGPATFDNACRGAGPLSPPDGLSHTDYIKRALEDELKVAGAHAAGTPRVTLTGTVNKLEFSSSRGLTGGSWTIDLTLRLSNGASMAANEYYEFHSGFIADTACKQTAEAYFPAVQNLIGKVVKSAEFAALVR
ncbi:MAG: hypothetical protein OEV81_08010 [Betaproteobacteria bacterium]|nr:hypothetical protein [Betaproteobacteria bacterium]